MIARSKPARLVQSVDRALCIIEILAKRPQGLGLSAVARDLGLAPQTTQTLLRTLEARGWATQNGVGTPYVLGPACHRIGRQWISKLDIAAIAHKRIVVLSEETGEYVLLATLRGGELVRLAEVASYRPLMVNSPAHSRAPYTMATGKIMMAYLDRQEQRAILKDVQIECPGPRSPRTKAELLRQLQSIRHDGFVECVDEAGEGIVAVARPVMDVEGRIVAALGIALPTIRYTDNHSSKVNAALQRAAKDIQRLWEKQGYVGPLSAAKGL